VQLADRVLTIPRQPAATSTDATAESATEVSNLTMARKPNYAFERNARAKAKAEKREAKRLAKAAEKARDSAEDPAVERPTGESESGREADT
jgi:hypothetical protein